MSQLSREDPRTLQRLSWLVFAVTFVGFGYFHPGSDGSNAARFAMVRAIVEQGCFTIDSYLIYRRLSDWPDDMQMVRVPIRNGEFDLGGQRYSVCWAKSQKENFELVPFNGVETPPEQRVDVLKVSSTLDLSFYDGHFHPNKAPGTSFLAVPAYFVLYQIERLAGLDPDHWWTLTMNAWLTSVFSVGLVSALACVIFFRLAMKFSDGARLASVLATVTFAFGTLFFPYATVLYEYNVASCGLLAALWLLWQVRDATGDEAGGGKRTRCYLFGAGLAAGWAAISNYVAALAVVMLGAYLIFAVRRNRGRLWFACGVAAPLLLVLFYNAACFGMPFTTNYREQAPFQKFEGAFMGVFTWPQWDALLAILFSPFRGVFYFSPVLLVGFYGAWLIARQRRYRAEWWVVVGVVMLYLLFSICYKGWQGGFAVVPRYFVPAAPFLALPVVMGFARRLWPTLAAAIYSVAVGFLIVAVNPFSPLGMHLMVKREGVSQWRHNQITDYLLPLLLRGDLENLISERIEYRVKENDAELAAARYSQEVRDASAQELRRRIRAEIASLENFWYVLLLAEPISANQLGIYEILPCRVFSADRIERKWNSFNVGEFLFPQSRWSLVPLLLVGGALFVALIRAARRHGSEANGLKFL